MDRGLLMLDRIIQAKVVVTSALLKLHQEKETTAYIGGKDAVTAGNAAVTIAVIREF